MRTSLAPRDALVSEFRRLAEDESSLPVETVADSKYIVELLNDGDLDSDELTSIFEEVAGVSATLEDFVSLHKAIDDLFEEEGGIEELMSLVPDGRCLVRSDYDEPDSLSIALDNFEPTEEVVVDEYLDDKLLGTWDLAYASSPAFHFNGGYTGVAKTYPGGATFVSLSQTLARDLGGAPTASIVETLKPSVGDDFDVDVNADWKFQRTMDPLTRQYNTILQLTPRSVKYGLVSVDGDRVKKGWKTMRVINSGSLIYIDDNCRIQQGTTANAWFVWRKRA